MSSSSTTIRRANSKPVARGEYDPLNDVVNVICQCGITMRAATFSETPGFSKVQCPLCGRWWTAVLTMIVARGEVI